MTYDELATEVARRFPSLAPRIRDEAVDWAPDPVGGDIVLADIFVPFFVAALRSTPQDESTVREAAGFVEELASSPDEALRTAARLSVLQALEDYPKELPMWTRWLGPAARAMLPTRGEDGSL